MIRKIAGWCSRACVLAAVMLFASGCATAKFHPEFKERQKNVTKVAVVAPQIDAYLLTFKGDRNRLDYVAKIMEKAMVDGAEYTFSQKGYAVKKLDLSEAALAARPELRTAVFNVNKLVDKALSDMKMNKQRKFTYTVGPDVNPFADLSDSDVLVFMRAVGFEKSEGQIAQETVKAVAVTVASAMVGAAVTPTVQAGAVTIEIAVVDGNDGAVLYYNANGADAGNYSPRSNWQVSNLTRSLLLPFPDRAPDAVPAERPAAVTPAQVGAGEVKPVSVAPVTAPAAAGK